MQEVLALLELIRISLRQEGPLAYDKDVDANTLIQMIKRQNLMPLVWPAMERQEDERWKKMSETLATSYARSLQKAFIQQIEIQDLLERMEKNGLDCLPLKGVIMSRYYPEPTFRSMTDFDVLLRDFDEKKLQTFMEELGYEPEILGDEHHDVYIKKPSMVVELHKSLSDEKVEKEIPQIDEWLEEIWEHCILVDDKKHIYKLTDEDFYIYHLIHMYKHIRISGVGIRPLIDIYVFMEQLEGQLDWDYLDASLAKLQLKQFEFVMRTLSKHCFANDEITLDEKEQKVLNFLLLGGCFGNKQMGTTIKVVTESEQDNDKSYESRRRAVIWQTVFQPAKVLEIRYPILRTAPFLLPFIWILRLFRIVFKERHKMKMITEASKKSEYDAMKEIFQFTGIQE